MFKFKVSNDLRNYKENQIYIDVSMIGNNIKFFLTELEKFNVLLKKAEPWFFQKIDFLNKGKMHQKKESLDSTYVEIMGQLNKITQICVNLFPESKKDIQGRLKQINDSLLAKKEDYYEGCMILLESYYRDMTEIVEKKIQMCQKLKLIDSKTLKAIVTFFPNGYDTHFTKYHLNLEEFADQLHSVLKEELDQKFISKYRELEDKHFQLMENKEDNNLITLKSFLEFSDAIMENYSEIKTFPEKFINAQVNKVSIGVDIDGLMNLYSRIENKFSDIYEGLQKVCNDDLEVMFLRVISIMYEIKLVDFINLNIAGMDKLFEVAKSKSGIENKINYVSLANLFRTEPNIAKQVMSNAINKINIDGEYSIHSPVDKFMIKKAKRNFFDNNQYYNHELLMYEIFPKEVEYKKNRYIQNSGYDKVFIGEKIHRIHETVYSHILRKTITYEFYIKTSSFYVNTHS